MDEDLLRCTIDVKRLVQRTILGQRKKPRRGDTGQGVAGALLSGADFQVSSGRNRRLLGKELPSLKAS